MAPHDESRSTSTTRREALGSLLRGAALTAALGAGAGCAARSAPASTSSGRGGPLRALAFDAFPVLDPRPIQAAVASHLGAGVADRTDALMTLWRTRQFEYTWLRASAGRYVDFWRVTEDALGYAVRALDIPLNADARRGIMRAYLRLPSWPDAAGALASLRSAGVRLAFLSNFTPTMLTSCIEHAGLGGVFERVLSTDAARTYKPDPAAYQLAVDAFGLPREQIGFVAFAPWDAAGAAWFGFPTFWVNRLSVPMEALNASPTAVSDLDALVPLVRAAAGAGSAGPGVSEGSGST